MAAGTSLTFGQQAAIAGIGALGGLGGGLLSSVSSARAAKRAYKYSLKLQQHQYDLNQRSLRESPLASREGYVNAGYNPLLAMGSQGMGFNSGASMTPTENNLAGDVSNGINSALSMMTTRSQIDNMNADTDVKKYGKEGAIIKNLPDLVDEVPKKYKTAVEAKILGSNSNSSRSFMENFAYNHPTTVRVAHYLSKGQFGLAKLAIDQRRKRLDSSNSAVSSQKFRYMSDYDLSHYKGSRHRSDSKPPREFPQ